MKLRTLLIFTLISLISTPIYSYDENEEIFRAKQRGESTAYIRDLEQRLHKEKYRSNYVPAYGDVTPTYNTAPYQKSLDRIYDTRGYRR